MPRPAQGAPQSEPGAGQLLLLDADLMWRAVLATIEGLTTEEFLWEPVDGCWSLRPAADGGCAQDWMPSPPAPPFTTIAWRLAHIGQSLASHSRRLFQRGSFSYETYRPAGSVDGERAFLEESFAGWRDGIGACKEVTMELASEVLSFNHHHLGHAKEIDAIRQLYRARRPLDDDPVLDACLRGDADAVRALASDDRARRDAIARLPDLVTTAAAMGWWTVVAGLVELGWPPDSAVGVTALHHAAGLGTAEVVRTLLDHGADPTRTDPEWNATPRGWAVYFGNSATMPSLP